MKRNLVHSCELVRSSEGSYIDVRLDDDMLPFLIGVTECFSAPKLENIRHFKKDQHFKLYAYFYSYAYRGTTGEVCIEQIRTLLNINKNQYQLVGHLKSRLLLPSIKLINQVTDIKVSLSDVRYGKKITGFVFDIKKQKNIAIKKSNPKCESSPSDDLLSWFLSQGISQASYQKLLSSL